MQPSIQQLISLQQAAPRNSNTLSTTNAHVYEQNQTDSQHIRIESQQSNVSVNLAQLLPNFLNIGSQQKHCYYQIKDFSFCNDFNTFYPNSSILLTVELGISYKDADDVVQTDTEIGQMEIKLPSQYTLTQLEICDYINYVIQSETILERATYLNGVSLQLDTYKSSGYIKEYFLPLITFKYDTSSHKLQCKANFDLEGSHGLPRVPKSSYENINRATFTDALVINTMNLTLSFPDDLQSDSVTQISQLLGFDYQQTFLTFAFDWFLLFQNALLNAYDPDNERTLAQVYYSPTTMQNSSVQQIQLRSNLTSNYWDKRGIKSDILKSIFVKSNIGETESISFTDTRVYEVKETVDGIRNFNLSITDQNNQPLVFKKPYSLTLSVFFDKSVT